MGVGEDPQCLGGLELHQCPSRVSQGAGRGRVEGSGCPVHWIHYGSNAGVSVEPKVSCVVAVLMGLGHKSHQVQSLRQG